MSKCEIDCWVISEPATGAGSAICRCKTHNFDMTNMQIDAATRCPIGQIEDATDKALEKIRTVIL